MLTFWPPENPARKRKLIIALDVLLIRLQNTSIAKISLDVSSLPSKVRYTNLQSWEEMILSTFAQTSQSRSQESSGVEKLWNLKFSKFEKNFSVVVNSSSKTSEIAQKCLIVFPNSKKTLHKLMTVENLIQNLIWFFEVDTEHNAHILTTRETTPRESWSL